MLVGAAQDVSKIYIEDIMGFTFYGAAFLARQGLGDIEDQPPLP